MLKFYNSLTKQKETFIPIVPNKIGIYVCGITVYDYCHIGHGRMCVVFDMITRFLRSVGYEVTYVRNITDIDDKIIKRAQEQNIPYEELTEKFIAAMIEDETALNVLRPDIEPRATEHMPQMIAMIQSLMDKDFAYQAGNGDICYRVNKFKNYGQLSHKDIEGLRSGARVDIAEGKEDPLDFVLWKMSKPDEPKWDSPWGDGRPGWHIECSAMSTECLGNHFDIHGGGMDLQFPHHENEIAQAQAATEDKFASTWIHNGFVQINEEKMSKSLGNFFTIRDVLKDYAGEVIRYFIISSHYRSPVNYSTESLEIAHSALKTFYKALRGLPIVDAPEQSEYVERFNVVMLDDFNTPEALAVMFDLVHEINRQREHDINKAAELAASLRQLGDVLGILSQDPQKFLQGEAGNLKGQIEKFIAEREQARKDKNWQLADQLRDQLTELNVELEDTPNGTIWTLKG